jgi:hypothetical protein
MFFLALVNLLVFSDLIIVNGDACKGYGGAAPASILLKQYGLTKTVKTGHIDAFCRLHLNWWCRNRVILARSLLLSILGMGGYIDIGGVSG